MFESLHVDTNISMRVLTTERKLQRWTGPSKYRDLSSVPSHGLSLSTPKHQSSQVKSHPKRSTMFKRLGGYLTTQQIQNPFRILVHTGNANNGQSLKLQAGSLLTVMKICMSCKNTLPTTLPFARAPSPLPHPLSPATAYVVGLGFICLGSAWPSPLGVHCAPSACRRSWRR
jgi:hypothetical protein